MAFNAKSAEQEYSLSVGKAGLPPLLLSLGPVATARGSDLVTDRMLSVGTGYLPPVPPDLMHDSD
jgi:hypothetical protein